MGMQAYVIDRPMCEVEGRSLRQDAQRRLFRNKAAVVSMVLLLLILLGAIGAPGSARIRSTRSYRTRSGCRRTTPRASSYYNGRDLFVRAWYG